MLLLHFNFSSSGKGLWNTLYLCTSVCCLFVHRFSLEPLVETWFILCKVRLSSSLQSDCAGFFWKKDSLGLFGWRGFKMGPNWGYSSYMKNWRMEFFWFFALTYSNIISWNWLEWFFGGRSGFEVFKPKVAKMGPKWGFSGGMKKNLSEFFWSFAWSYSCI